MLRLLPHVLAPLLSSAWVKVEPGNGRGRRQVGKTRARAEASKPRAGVLLEGGRIWGQ